MSTLCYVAGDVHQPGGRVTAFDHWLDELARLPARRLILLGDLFEVWLESAAAVRHHAGTLARLRRLARRGWRLDLVPGNRELAGVRRLCAAAGLRAAWPDLRFAVAGHGFRVVHGDRLCRDPGYHCFAATMRSFWFQGAGRCLPAWWREWFGARVRRRSRRKQRRARARGAQPGRLAAGRLRAAARGFDTVIAGHIHQQWRRRLLGHDLVLVGDWSDDSGHWLEIDDRARLTLCQGRFPAAA